MCWKSVPGISFAGPKWDNSPLSYYQYSYTQYDPLGRIAEVGQIYALSDPTPTQINHTNWPFNWGHSEEEVVRTRYDIPLGGIPSDVEQKNLRNRVATTHYDDDGIDDYDYATHYTYDAHGNVDTLWQEYVPLEPIGQDLKKLVYDYDLVSGNVNEVAYQEGHTDQFFHRYTYDSDNRITEVQTSRDGIIWDRDAGYSYYRHGPLARMEIGEHNVQGVDYAYTVHGWIKGVNSNVLEDNKDIGMDGHPNGPNGTFARDAFGFTLGYYEGDYIPINQRHTEALQNYFLASTSGSELGDASPDLWNGNIRHMVTSLMDDSESYLTPQGTAYTYDQLNRLTHMQVFQGITSNAWDASGSELSQHGVDTITYDGNGNILGLIRNGNKTGGDLPMDSLTYHYTSNTNQLEYVDDDVGQSTYDNDIDDQSANNYDYDEIGNLVSDDAEGISQIQWYVNGKIRAINRSSPTQSQPNLKFAYGPSGQRIRKAVTWSGGGDTTWYVRDPQGNVMAVYRERNDSLFVKEHYIYGSSRLGSIHDWTFVTAISAHSDSNRYSRVLGEKYYELSNHLGNVLATVTDQKKAHNSSGSVDYWEPTVASYSDYYPFGSIMPGRSFNSGNYRYGFIGAENDNEISGQGNSQDHKFRSYDPRLGRYKSVDPLAPSYPWYTPYQYAGNTPIMAIDIEGLEPSTVVDKQGKLTTSAIKILNVLTGVDEVLLQQVQIMGSVDNKFNAPWYNPNKGGGALTVGSTMYFTENWFAESGYGSKKYGNTSYGGEDARSVFMWIGLLSHEAGHLPQADAFGTDKAGIRSYLGYFAGGYILRSITFQFPVHDGFAAEVTAELGQYVFNQIFIDTDENGNQSVNQLGKDFMNAVADGNEEKVNEMLSNMDEQIKTHTDQYKKDNAKKFQKMERRLEKAERKKEKREAKNSN